MPKNGALDAINKFWSDLCAWGEILIRAYQKIESLRGAKTVLFPIANAFSRLLFLPLAKLSLLNTPKSQFLPLSISYCRELDQSLT